MSAKEMMWWFVAVCLIVVALGVFMGAPKLFRVTGWAVPLPGEHFSPWILLTAFGGLLFFGILAGLARMQAANLRDVRKAFRSHFYRDVPEKKNRFLLQAYVNSVLRTKGAEFNEICGKERDFLLKVEEINLASGGEAEARIKEHGELINKIRAKKIAFWDAWESARLNGFKVFPRVIDYTRLDV